MKVSLPASERSLPTSVEYRSERISSFAIPELVFADNAPASDILTRIREWRKAQFLDLDEQERDLRARFDMPVPKSARPSAPVGDEQLSKLRELVAEYRRLAMKDPEIAKPTTRDQAAALIRGLGDDVARLRGGAA